MRMNGLSPTYVISPEPSTATPTLPKSKPPSRMPVRLTSIFQVLWAERSWFGTSRRAMPPSAGRAPCTQLASHVPPQAYRVPSCGATDAINAPHAANPSPNRPCLRPT